MECVDCKEWVTERERATAFHCTKCKGVGHSECAMLGGDAREYCEACFFEVGAKRLWSEAKAARRFTAGFDGTQKKKEVEEMFAELQEGVEE